MADAIIFNGPRIKPLPSIELSEIPVVKKDDMIQTFKNKTVFFIGDPMLRVLFRACVKMLQQEHIHSNGEADGCRIDTKLIQGKLTTGSIFFSFIHFR
jgi:hypothetical protein